jgi:hypothetical protein
MPTYGTTVRQRTVVPGGLGVCFDLPTATIGNGKEDGQGHALPTWKEHGVPAVSEEASSSAVSHGAASIACASEAVADGQGKEGTDRVTSIMNPMVHGDHLYMSVYESL